MITQIASSEAERTRIWFRGYYWGCAIGVISTLLGVWIRYAIGG